MRCALVSTIEYAVALARPDGGVCEDRLRRPGWKWRDRHVPARQRYQSGAREHHALPPEPDDREITRYLRKKTTQINSRP